MIKDQIADSFTAWQKMPKGCDDGPEQARVWDIYIPNREHWWMKDTLEAMPKLRSMVTFRLCTQRCPENRLG